MERNSVKRLVVLHGFYCNSTHKYVYLALKPVTKAHHLKCFSVETAMKKKEIQITTSRSNSEHFS